MSRLIKNIGGVLGDVVYNCRYDRTGGIGEW